MRSTTKMMSYALEKSLYGNKGNLMIKKLYNK